MNKKELIEALNKKIPSVSTNEIDLLLIELTQEIQNQVSQGERVTLVGFGTFEPRQRKATTKRNPSTGEAVDVPAKTVPAFTAGTKFKAQVLNSCPDGQCPMVA